MPVEVTSVLCSHIHLPLAENKQLHFLAVCIKVCLALRGKCSEEVIDLKTTTTLFLTFFTRFFNKKNIGLPLSNKIIISDAARPENVKKNNNNK